MLLILALMLGAWTARCRAYKSQLALKATWASSRPLLPPLYATACPGGSQHVPQGCLAVQRACLDQGTVVLAGDERFIPTPDRNAQPLPQYRPSRAFHFPFPGAASNPDALASPAGLERLPPLAFRPLSAWEPTPDLQRPQVQLVPHSATVAVPQQQLPLRPSCLPTNPRTTCCATPCCSSGHVSCRSSSTQPGCTTMGTRLEMPPAGCIRTSSLLPVTFQATAGWWSTRPSAWAFHRGPDPCSSLLCHTQ